MERRIITTDVIEEDLKTEGNLRPQLLVDYIGQEKAKENLKVYIEAAKQRGDTLDHVLFYGPPGLGKTTLAGIIANDMGVNIKVTSGPAIEKPGDMAAILNNLSEGDILFVDEIHRLNRQVEEVLYPAMEDYKIDIMIGKGATARSEAAHQDTQEGSPTAAERGNHRSGYRARPLSGVGGEVCRSGASVCHDTHVGRTDSREDGSVEEGILRAPAKVASGPGMQAEEYPLRGRAASGLV